jgi:hypothetical protein
MQKLSRILLIVGPCMFIAGAFTLAPTGFFEATDPASQIAVIEGNRSLWLIGWILLGISALTVAGGLVLFSRNLQLSTNTSWIVGMGYVAAAFAVAGALCYTTVAIISVTQSAENFVAGTNGLISTLGSAYGILTLPAILIYGIVLFLSKRRILGGLLIIAPIFSVVSGLYQVPLTNYIPLLIMGITLLVRPIQQGTLATSANPVS